MTENKDGWPNKIHILPTPIEIIKSIGSFIKESCSMHQLSTRSDHFVPFQDDPNYWKAAEEVHTTGSESDSIMETFE